MASAVQSKRGISIRPSAAAAARSAWPIVLVFGATAIWMGHYAAQATQWSVMTDELQVERLAIAVIKHGAVLPTIHGVRVPVYSQLYPLLSAPFYALSMPSAWHAVHVFNAVLMASTAIPVYLTARLVGADRLASSFAALATALVPWMSLSTTLLTEMGAYPAFAWAVYLVARSLAAPSAKADVLALLGLGLALLARTQFAILVLLVPVALLVHALTFRDPGEPLGWARRLRNEVVAHRVLLGGYALAALYIVIRLATGQTLQSLLGTYSGTASGNLLPKGIVQASTDHFDEVIVAAGYVPLILGSAWLLHTVVKPRTKAAHAFAVLALLAVPLVTLEVASFDLRFTPGGYPQERYLFYVVPLLIVAAMTLLSEGGRRWVALAAGGVFSAWLVGRTSYASSDVIYWASPGIGFHGVLTGRSWQLGHWVGIHQLSAREVFRWGTIPFVIAVGLLLHFGRARIALVFVGVLLCTFLLLETRYIMNRIVIPSVTRGTPGGLPYDNRNWIDRTVGGGEVGLLPAPQPGQSAWWDSELWNKSVERVYATPGVDTYTPFPAETLDLSSGDGTVKTGHETPWLVTAGNENRVGFHGASVVAQQPSLYLLKVPLPYRMDWATRSGLYPDGWTLGGKPVVIDVFPPPGPRPRLLRIAVSLTNTAGITVTQPYTLTGDGVHGARAKLAPGKSGSTTVTACPPVRGHVRLFLKIPHPVHISDGRVAGLHFDGVAVTQAGGC